jgi:hypothetical protein
MDFSFRRVSFTGAKDRIPFLLNSIADVPWIHNRKDLHEDAGTVLNGG